MKKSQNPSCCDQSTSSCAPVMATSRRRFHIAAGAAAAVGSGFKSVFAAGMGQTYSDAVMSHPALGGYWRLDGDFSDAKGQAPAKAAGKVEFVEGAVGGQAIQLVPDHSVSVPNINHLRSPEKRASVELFFRLPETPGQDHDPVIIAQADSENTRFIVGVKKDLSALTYTNGLVMTTVHLPTTEPVETGRWYHLVVTSNPLDLRIYVDGYECTLTGGALDFTRRKIMGVVPMTFGALSGGNNRSTAIEVDEVAYYVAGLSIEDIQGHLTAGGWEKRLNEVGRIVERLKSDREKVNQKQVQQMLKDPALTEAGSPRTYRDKHLEAISLTVGGIGAGGIQFNGNGEPAIWQIATNHAEIRVPDTFLAVRAQPNGGQPVIRALQTRPVGAFKAMKSLSFQGEYPFGWYHFEDASLPVKVELEVFNPLTPMDLKNSSIPCAIYTVKTTNTSQKPVQVDVLASQQNAIGYAEGVASGYGGNSNHVMAENGSTRLHMTRTGKGGQPEDMVLMTQAPGISGVASWDSSAELYRSFEAGGRLEGQDKAGPSLVGQTVNGAMSAPLTLDPGETKSVTYVLTWYFPNTVHGSQSSKNLWLHTGNMYTNWWSSAVDVADYMAANLDDLAARSRLFHDTLYASNVPRWLLDRLSSQMAVMRSQTCWWSADGYFGAWEGCKPTQGCCGGNCTHVWHYAQAHARLLPELGRRMREQDFDYQLETGLIPYRHSIKKTAADGFFGTILNAYREYLCSSDEVWLKTLWPKIKKGMDGGIKEWDPNQDGFLQNIQHNTLDGEMAGCSSWIGTLYLSALQAMANMADRMGEPDLASRYRTIHKSGAKLQNERLWNGAYYIQATDEKRMEDYLDGCHIDQVLGEWWADQVDLPRNYPKDRVTSAMRALLKHNFLPNFSGQSLKPRQYVTDSDAGMKMITWPRNPQPIPGMKYGDEVMTGFEYGAGVSMLQNGMLKEGLMVLKAIYDRYDGCLRTEGITDMGGNAAWGYTGNPFGDDECGKFYGRSLSVWSALLALQGFVYDGPAGRIGFLPRWKPEEHASFFTVAEGYGLFTQQLNQDKLTASIDLKEGQLHLNEVDLSLGNAKQPESIHVKLGDRSVNTTFGMNDGRLRISFKKTITLKSDQMLDIEVDLKQTEKSVQRISRGGERNGRASKNLRAAKAEETKVKSNDGNRISGLI